MSYNAKCISVQTKLTELQLGNSTLLLQYLEMLQNSQILNEQ